MAFDFLSLVVVHGQAVTLNGRAARGKVTFASSAQLTDTTTGQAIFPVPQVVSFNNSGSFSIALPATNDPDISPVGWVYQVTVAVTGAPKRSFQLAVPYDAESIDLFAAAPSDDSGVVFVPHPTVHDLLAFALAVGGL